MAEDLMKSLAELDDMLKEMEKGHIEKPYGNDSMNAGDGKEYCIGNGAYVRIDEDGMSAWLYLNPPKKGEDYYERDEIMQFLMEHNVVCGYHTSNIAAIVKKHVYEREILVARGREAKEGQSGYYEYFFDTTDKRKPQIREDGTVDYTSASRLSNVKVGDKIAVYHHAVASENGYDVFGNDIPAKPARELPTLRGRNISNEGNPDVYTATIAGKIDVMDYRVDIKNVHEIYGSVDLITGKVEFFGDIHIAGNVGSGVLIRASRNVVIDGVVEAATIYAGGDVVIAKGMQGNQKGKITAKGNVSAEFLELTTVEAGGTVRSNSFVNSNVYAGEMVIAEGKNGVVLGGNVRGLLGVSAVHIGNDAEIKTTVGCGYSAEDYTNYLDSFRKEEDIQQLLSDTVERMTKILKDKRLGIDVENDALDNELLMLNEKKDEYFGDLDQAKKERERLSDVIQKGKGGMVLANEKIFRGVTIQIEDAVYQVPNNTSFMRYKNEGGKIVGSVIIV